MKRIILFATLAWAIAPGFAHKVRVDFDHGTQFGRYKTYRLVQSANVSTSDPAFPTQIAQDRIAGFIEEALAAKGMKRTTKGEDLQISYRVKVIEQPIYTTFSDGWGGGCGWGGGWGSGWGPGWGTGFATTTVQMTYQGVLVVEIVDAHQQKLVFEGTSAQMVSSKPEKNTRKLAKAVTEVFARYPPQP
jgi:hypothetical protein